MKRNNTDIQKFWSVNPCGESQVGGVQEDWEIFFNKYDQFRYTNERHILKCLDHINFNDKKTLEIGLGLGADSEQIIKRGAQWSGLDLTQESVDRVKTRLELRNLTYEDIKKGSVTALPYPDNHFDIVFSHGVLHHVPDVLRAQQEIARALKPSGKLIVMLYAKNSMNYYFSIAIIRRAILMLGYPFAKKIYNEKFKKHIANAKKTGLFTYLKLSNFLHTNTDGPDNPYSKVYTKNEIIKDFSNFQIERLHKEFMHAPPLSVHFLPGSSLLGWHLWVHMKLR
jgi:ubiquinone/menaquinone biosynthesis C-methylase UbiE